MHSNKDKKLTANHWGVGVATVKDGRVVSVEGHPDDPDASDINSNIPNSLTGRARVRRPAIRTSWLKGVSNDVPRGRDTFTEVSWDQALDLVSGEINRVRAEHGNTSIYAGSYGWSSAGRFHHAQSQLKRFLNTVGGFVRSEGNYSYNAALEIMPHIVGPFRQQVVEATRWSVIAKHAELVLLFGGMALRNTQVSDGGVARHRAADNLKTCADAGVQFINISPLRTDAQDNIEAQWLPTRPGSDTALMLGLAHTLVNEGLHDVRFLNSYTVGFDKFEAYLVGRVDGQPKDANWASQQTGIEAEYIVALAKRMATCRTMINLAAGVQRTDFGEQPIWMAVTLAAILGQIGLPGGGYTVGYGVNATIGNVERLFRAGSLPQGKNPVSEFIPVTLISEMLLNPGSYFPYQGQRLKFPDARLVWWAGGNPFHHHQDLNRLHRAFQRPETIIVNEINWTATARHADIVLPVAAPEERTDFGAGKSDNALVPMPQLVQPIGDAKTEYDLYTQLAQRLGTAEAFTSGMSEAQWLKRLWRETKDNAEASGVLLSDWDTFIRGDVVTFPDPSPDQVFLASFRADPQENALPTPSGLIELFSKTIDAMNLSDCPGHASWFAPRDATNKQKKSASLYLLSGQPKTRLHSQLDNGSYSLSYKIQGREPVLIHPDDAALRQIVDGDVVELFNERGRCLAGAKLTWDIQAGSVFLWTGAWFDPDFDAPQARDRHGNPNVLTHDYRTSSLGQSSAAHSALVNVRRFDEKLPRVRAHEPPIFERSMRQ